MHRGKPHTTTFGTMIPDLEEDGNPLEWQAHIAYTYLPYHQGDPPTAYHGPTPDEPEDVVDIHVEFGEDGTTPPVYWDELVDKHMWAIYDQCMEHAQTFKEEPDED